METYGITNSLKLLVITTKFAHRFCQNDGKYIVVSNIKNTDEYGPSPPNMLFSLPRTPVPLPSFISRPNIITYSISPTWNSCEDTQTPPFRRLLVETLTSISLQVLFLLSSSSFISFISISSSYLLCFFHSPSPLSHSIFCLFFLFFPNLFHVFDVMGFCWCTGSLRFGVFGVCVWGSVDGEWVLG